MSMFNYECDKLHEMGHVVKEADVKCYVSECVQSILEEVTPNYPQLSDYEREWVHFKSELYNAGEPVPLEYLTAEGTELTIPNSIPFHYKSAILKGQTLVNNLKEITLPVQSASVGNIDIPIITKINEGERYYAYVDIEMPSGTTRNLIGLLGNGDWQSYGPSLKSGINKVSLDAKSDLTEKLRIQADNGTILRSVVLMKENVEFINQFWGMKSVQMPVLTTTGKNLFDGKLEKGLIDGVTGIPSPNEAFVRSVNFIKVQPNMTYVISEKDDSTNFRAYEYDGNFNYIGYFTTKSFTTSSNTSYIKFRTYPKNSGDDVSRLDFKFMVETGNTITPYEPYKTNILTCLEPVELGVVGDVHDTLNLLTGEVVESTYEHTFNGTESNITLHSNQTNKMTFRLPLNIDIKPNDINGVICNKMKTVNLHSLLTDDNTIGVCTHNVEVTKNVYIAILKSDLETQNVNGCKKWLEINTPTVRVVANEKVHKTVDLSHTPKPLDDITYLTTSSNIIPPTIEVSCPVVSTGTKTLNEIITGE